MHNVLSTPSTQIGHFSTYLPEAESREVHYDKCILESNPRVLAKK